VMLEPPKAELIAPPVLVRVRVEPARASTVRVPPAVALTTPAPALAVPLWVRGPPSAVSVRLPPAVAGWPGASLVLALRVRLAPAVLRVLVRLTKVRAPPWAVKVTLLPAAVWRLRLPPCTARSLKVMLVWAVTLMLVVALTAARAPVETVPGLAPPSV